MATKMTMTMKMKMTIVKIAAVAIVLFAVVWMHELKHAAAIRESNEAYVEVWERKAFPYLFNARESSLDIGMREARASHYDWSKATERQRGRLAAAKRAMK